MELSERPQVVQLDRARRRIIEPLDERNEGGFAAATATNERHRRACLNGKIHTVQHLPRHVNGGVHDTTSEAWSCGPHKACIGGGNCTLRSGRDGYEKWTLLKRMAPRMWSFDTERPLAGVHTRKVRALINRQPPQRTTRHDTTRHDTTPARTGSSADRHLAVDHREHLVARNARLGQACGAGVGLPDAHGTDDDREEHEHDVATGVARVAVQARDDVGVTERSAGAGVGCLV